MRFRQSALSALVALSSLVLAVTADTADAAGVGFNPPEVAIVWPYQPGGPATNLTQSTGANVSVWPTGQTSCSPPPGIPQAQQVVLGMAHDNDPVAPLARAPDWVVRSMDGKQFPSEEFNDIPANLSTDPTGKYSFVVVGGVLSGGSTPTGNVWVHAADPRTNYPRQLQPTGFTAQTNPPVDLRIQVVFPHDAQGHEQPVGQAPLVNVAVDIFEHGTTLSVHKDFLQTIPSRYPVVLGLQIARGNQALAGYAGRPQATEYTVNGQQYPRWVFNDVPVDPTQPSHFMAILTGLLGGVTDGRQFSTIWTHAADARTYLPNPTVPPTCAS